MRSLDKYTIIGTVSIIIIVIPFAYAFWNVYAANNLQIRWSEPEDFNYFTLSNDGEISVCNAMPFFMSFEQIKFELVYQGDIKGEYITNGTTIQPNSSTELYGTYTSESFAESQYLFLHFDGQFDGTSPIRIDPTKMFVVTYVQTSLFGIIPFSAINEYTGIDFDEIMSGEVGDFACQSSL
jgi:hypothetical protein